MSSERVITISHSPDSDDAFMFYALTCGKIPTGGLEIRHELRDIETLNAWAKEGKSEVTALSLHAYAYVSDRYAILDSGASIGDRYGPIVVSKRPLDEAALRRATIAIPGVLTTATLALRLWHPEIKTQVYPFNEIFSVVNRGEAEAGLIIHEGQLTYGREGFSKGLDLGEWWAARTGLPLPLGVNGVRRDLGMPLMQTLARLQRESIAYALSHREEAMAYARRYSGDLSADETDRFVGMYVNRRTLAYGEEDKTAIARLLSEAAAAGIIPAVPRLDFISAA